MATQRTTTHPRIDNDTLNQHQDPKTENASSSTKRNSKLNPKTETKKSTEKRYKPY